MTTGGAEPQRMGKMSGGVLAAGRAERLGRSKAFVVFQSEPLILRAVRILRAAALDPVFVAVRECELETMRSLEALRDWEARGQVHFVVPPAGALFGASIQSLYAAAAAEAGNPLVLHQVDRPLVPLAWIQQLCARYREQDVHGAGGQPLSVVSAFQGVLMPPVVLPPGFEAVIQRLKGDVGLRGLFQSGEVPYLREDFPGDHQGESKLGFGFDLDTPEDLRCLLGDSPEPQKNGNADPR